MTLTEWMVRRKERAEKVAADSGVAKSVLSRFLNGEGMLTPANIGRLVTYTHGKVTFEDLLAEYEEKAKQAEAVK